MKNVFFIFFLSLLCSTTVLGASPSLPEFAYKQFPIAEESNDEVHELVAQAAAQIYPEPLVARSLLVKALQKVNKGAKIDEYDYLWTQYGLLKSSFDTGGANYGPGNQEDYMKVAHNVLNFLDTKTNTGDWVFTETGAFRMEVYREAGNGLAWELMESAINNAVLKKALTIVNKTEAYIRDEKDYYILDTKVRILLKLKKEAKAFEIVKNVLSENPDFGDFQNFYDNNKYKTWLKSNF
jgi:hypothetical protein